MNSLQEYKLSEEFSGIRRLIWILQMKQGSSVDSRFRRWFNLKRDKQVILLKNIGFPYSQLCEKAKKYGCVWEMFQ